MKVIEQQLKQTVELLSNKTQLGTLLLNCHHYPFIVTQVAATAKVEVSL